MDPTYTRLARELFLTTAAPALVREVATILAPANIPVMPLKGVLLQRLVYQTGTFRPMADVDILVPPALFSEARHALRRAGFATFCEGQDVLRRPGQFLEVDLHRRLSTTTRSRLLPDDMFRRGQRDTRLFGVEVVIPSPADLYAHLLLHLTLHWVNRGTFHHPEDLEAVPEALSVTASSMAEHLKTVGLERHAFLILPLIDTERPGGFAGRLLSALARSSSRTPRAWAEISRRLCAQSAPGSAVRRVGGFLLAPSLADASREALLGRLLGGQRSSDIGGGEMAR